jgi:hypothetical protein
VACVLWAKQRKPILEPRWHNSNQPVLELVSAKPGSAGAMFQQDYYNGSSVTIRWSHSILKKLYFIFCHKTGRASHSRRWVPRDRVVGSELNHIALSSLPTPSLSVPMKREARSPSTCEAPISRPPCAPARTTIAVRDHYWSITRPPRHYWG